MESIIHKVIGIVLAVVFGVLAVLHFWDEDPLTWPSVYGMFMALVLVNIFRPLPFVISLIPMLGALAGAVLLWPEHHQDFSFQMENFGEGGLSSESLGLLVGAAACAYLSVRSWRRLRLMPDGQL